MYAVTARQTEAAKRQHCPPRHIPGGAAPRIAGGDTAQERHERLELEHIIACKQIVPVFQPIFSLCDGGAIGHESLSRLVHEGSITNPEQLFDVARKHGFTAEIEKLCREKALTRACELDLHGLIFLNVCPALLHTEGHRPGFTAELLDFLGVDKSRIVFELTEKTLITDYALFERGVAHYRSQGYRIAIDDLGDGYAGLKMLSQVIPDYVKLARFLVSDIDRFPAKQALAEALVCFSKKIGARVIAEGIERPEELGYFASIGADYGQGYLLGRPDTQPNAQTVAPLLRQSNAPGRKAGHLPCRLTRTICP